MYIPITLKSRSSRTIRKFHIDGVHNLEIVMQFIWRDLLLSILAHANERLKKAVPEMLADIESVMDSKGLIQVLHGGRKC